MKHSARQHRRSGWSHRSSSLALNPYFIEDIAMTPGEFEQMRSREIRFVGFH
jgi:hypothetical protein